MTYAVHSFSHWQGARNPGHRVAVFSDRAEAEALVDEISTCSFCTPGRTSNYSVGGCYGVYRSNRPATDSSVADYLMRIRDSD